MADNRGRLMESAEFYYFTTFMIMADNYAVVENECWILKLRTTDVYGG